jgi:hypothetical protein
LGECGQAVIAAGLARTTWCSPSSVMIMVSNRPSASFVDRRVW